MGALAPQGVPQGTIELLGADWLAFPWAPIGIFAIYMLIFFFFLAAFFARMIAEGKISGILRAYLRGVLVPLFVFSVLRFAVN